MTRYPREWLGFWPRRQKNAVEVEVCHVNDDGTVDGRYIDEEWILVWLPCELEPLTPAAREFLKAVEAGR